LPILIDHMEFIYDCPSVFCLSMSAKFYHACSLGVPGEALVPLVNRDCSCQSKLPLKATTKRTLRSSEEAIIANMADYLCNR